jgi:hypothetical protein
MYAKDIHINANNGKLVELGLLQEFIGSEISPEKRDEEVTRY